MHNMNGALLDSPCALGLAWSSQKSHKLDRLFYNQQYLCFAVFALLTYDIV